MKKIIFTLALALGLGLVGYSQESGLFGYGPSRGGSNDNYSSSSYDRDNPSGLMLPTSHGGTTDVTPLGTGTALLLGLGAAYLVSKRNRKK